ncbi:OLC1v1012479C1 [Oldenlandia corymbosa var. corymbosa]|uniref:OLC1v1012479C1 n=1 Tax=Oldenlandia corymbosa var. corymbosa TaxID=529605 RepID=A0AAV1DWQ0_OLDCO|nr:OLC1v1012479C1 [Oldenlandia corymbosa var. corymbosa]
MLGRRCKVESSCHGLVLISNECSKFLMNLITSEAIKLQPFGFFKAFFEHYVHVLGYNDTNVDYKIVTILCCRARLEPELPKTKVDVYSVKTKTWKSLPDSSYDHYESFESFGYGQDGVLLNGYVHLLATDNQTQVSSPAPTVTTVFNLTHERFDKVVPSPKDIANIHCGRLTTCGGCLALILCYYYYDFDVWVMKDCGVQESWTRFTIACRPYGGFSGFRPTYLLSDDKVVFVVDCWKWVALTPSSGVWRDLEMVGFPNENVYDILTFKESLLSPNYGS